MATTQGAATAGGDRGWGAGWLAATMHDLTSLGFELRDGLAPGALPGPRLLVALRPTPTLEHFDPEVVTYWIASEGRGRLATLEREGAGDGSDDGAPQARGTHAAGDAAGVAGTPWSWGPIRLTDRIPVRNTFLGFGGVLLRATAADTTWVAFTSPAPIVRWAGHSQGIDPLVDEIGAFFGRLMVPVDFQDGAEARIAGTGPEALYASFLAHALARLHGSRRLWDADPSVADRIEREVDRLQATAPAHWAEGEALLGWLELG